MFCFVVLVEAEEAVRYDDECDDACFPVRGLFAWEEAHGNAEDGGDEKEVDEVVVELFEKYLVPGCGLWVFDLVLSVFVESAGCFVVAQAVFTRGEI